MINSAIDNKSYVIRQLDLKAHRILRRTDYLLEFATKSKNLSSCFGNKYSVFRYPQDWACGTERLLRNTWGWFSFFFPQNIFGLKYSNYLKFYWLAAQEIQVVFFNPQVYSASKKLYTLLNHFTFWPEGITLSGDEMELNLHASKALALS